MIFVTAITFFLIGFLLGRLVYYAIPKEREYASRSYPKKTGRRPEVAKTPKDQRVVSERRV